jgi:hypothetical protein
MKLVVTNGMLTLGSITRLIAVGWFFGLGTICLIVLIFLALGGPIVAGLANEPHLPSFSQILGLLILPIVLALQAVAVGAVGALGVSVYRRYRKIELVGEKTDAASL